MYTRKRKTNKFSNKEVAEYLNKDIRTKHIHQEIRSDLKKHIEKKYREGAERYIKEGIKLHGVRSFLVRKISAKYYAKIRKNEKKEIFRLCEELLKSGYAEEKTIAFDWAFRLRKRYEVKDFYIFESWLKKYVTNWGSCDDFCRHAFGHFILQFPEYLLNVKKWTKSNNRWLKRAAAVIMIEPIRSGKYLKTVFEIANSYLKDQDYLVQNGYGWMLKDASILYPSEVLDYVMKHKDEMPRRALRYAIERLPPQQKKNAMSKE